MTSSDRFVYNQHRYRAGPHTQSIGANVALFKHRILTLSIKDESVAEHFLTRNKYKTTTVKVAVLYLLRVPPSSHELLTIIVHFIPILVSTRDPASVYFVSQTKDLRPFDSTLHTNIKKPAESRLLYICCGSRNRTGVWRL